LFHCHFLFSGKNNSIKLIVYWRLFSSDLLRHVFCWRFGSAHYLHLQAGRWRQWIRAKLW
jgi:hypothetical protein